MKPASTSPDPVTLDVTGMTCAACASRIERKLNKLDGVVASVNYATEQARIEMLSTEDDRLGVDDLIATIKATGYGAHLPSADVETPDRLVYLRRRLVVAFVLGVPVLVLSMIPAVQFDGWQWVALALATPVATWAAWPFHRAMALNLRHAQATMDTLISVGVGAAYVWSLWALLFTSAGEIGMSMSMSLDVRPDGGGQPHIYLEVASTIVAFILAGRYFEASAKRRAGDALRALLDLGAKDVAILDDSGIERRLPIEQLSVGDRFVVRPGEQIATDGRVIEGASAIDRSLVTGESMPVEVGVGDDVIGATINADGRLVVEALRVGSETQLARMAQMVEAAQSGKAPVQRLADRVAAVFVPIVIGLALLTLVAWLVITGDTERSFSAAVAVLIIACPCALGLATPTALLVGTGRGAQLGVVIRGPEILENTRQVDTIVLDKTGTVTTGTMTLAAVRPFGDLTDDEVLRIAGALESASEHPIARAVTAAANAAGPAAPVVDFRNLPGLGVRGTLDGVVYEVGRPSTSMEDDGESGQDGPGRTIVELRALHELAEPTVLGHLVVTDSVKPTSAAAIRHFRQLGLEPVLLTGDNAATARSVAAEVGIDQVHAEVLPADKVDVVTELQRAGKVVAMVGDGVNDSAALVAADLGISMGSGTSAAIEASDITLVRDDLMAAVDAIALSRRTLGTIKTNLFWAFSYNVVAIPLAMSGRLSPAIAGAAMAFSSVFVVSNSLRLKRFRPTPTT
ncbi:MAG: heavy metal translocating P-type ATPase [Ilumatobacter sp.]